eukprot:Blabericola_migrator_1__6444@NODE_3250_length_1911_cov_578_263015_g2033_i0_p2_GENE_NODE_3250_length_1911_cov_578_263015_g2033_i0NODE_3250_length_1911_cov_578_263015_g2033_i0_p2_ORF_typecomplete_len236_score36_53_NODE_3250_length_1911_cov_578_263015_g2033_i05712
MFRLACLTLLAALRSRAVFSDLRHQTDPSSCSVRDVQGFFTLEQCEGGKEEYSNVYEIMISAATLPHVYGAEDEGCQNRVVSVQGDNNLWYANVSGVDGMSFECVMHNSTVNIQDNMEREVLMTGGTTKLMLCSEGFSGEKYDDLSTTASESSVIWIACELIKGLPPPGAKPDVAEENKEGADPMHELIVNKSSRIANDSTKSAYNESIENGALRSIANCALFLLITTNGMYNRS